MVIKMEVKLDIKEVVVIRGLKGADIVKVVLADDTSLPVVDNTTFSTEVLSGTGWEWCKSILGVEPRVIDLNAIENNEPNVEEDNFFKENPCLSNCVDSFFGNMDKMFGR